MPRAMNCFRRRLTCLMSMMSSALTIALGRPVDGGQSWSRTKLAARRPSEPVRLRDLLQGDDSVIQTLCTCRASSAPRPAQAKCYARHGKQCTSPIIRDHRETDWARLLRQAWAIP